MSDKLGIGMIGCGEIALRTSKAILDSGVVRVVHCADPLRHLAEDIAREHDARASDNPSDLLADGDVKAVVIATPHYLHSPLAVEAARAGKHVLTEKPMACTLAGADAMIEAAGEAGVKLAVLLPMRLSSAIRKMREMVRGGALGRVVAVKLHCMSDKPAHYWEGGFTGRVRSEWRKFLDTSGGGILIMNMVHNIDAMIFMIDPDPERIYAEYGTFRTPVEVEDFISFVMRLKGGAIVSFDASSAAPGREAFGDRIYGEKGQIAIGARELRLDSKGRLAPCGSGPRAYLEEPWGDIGAGEWVPIRGPTGRSDPRREAIEGFARAVVSGGDVSVSGREGRRSLEIIRGAYLSMKRGAPVEFPVKE